MLKHGPELCEPSGRDVRRSQNNQLQSGLQNPRRAVAGSACGTCDHLAMGGASAQPKLLASGRLSLAHEPADRTEPLPPPCPCGAWGTRLRMAPPFASLRRT